MTTLDPNYAYGRLARALTTARDHGDARVRRNAAAKIERWTAVIDGMLDGSLTVGSRTPVADTPAWVTLEVADGGFATGRCLAGGELLDHDVGHLSLRYRLGPDVPQPLVRRQLLLLPDA